MEQLLLYKALIISVVFACCYSLEWLAPNALNIFSRLENIKRQVKNISLFIINMAVSRFIVIPITVVATQYNIEWRADAIPVNATGQIIISLVILDFFIYWWHRANHEIPFLWRFHQVHHLDQFLDTTSAVRFHAGEVLLSAIIRSVVIIVMDISLEAILYYETLLLVASIIQHSNIRLPKKIEYMVNFIIVTPAWHWLHHHAKRRDTDSHYGNALTVWDRLFKTRAGQERTPSMPIGVQHMNDRNIIKLLLAPFLKMR